MSSYKVKMYFIILIGIIVFFVGIFQGSVVMVFIGIIESVFGFLWLTFLKGYHLFNQAEDIHEVLKNNSKLHLAICSECFKENILEDIYCTKCGAKLGEDDGKKL